MKKVYVVTVGYLKFAFSTIGEARKFFDHLDKYKKNGSLATVHCLEIHDNAEKLIETEKDLFK